MTSHEDPAHTRTKTSRRSSRWRGGRAARKRLRYAPLRRRLREGEDWRRVLTFELLTRIPRETPRGREILQLMNADFESRLAKLRREEREIGLL